MFKALESSGTALSGPLAPAPYTATSSLKGFSPGVQDLPHLTRERATSVIYFTGQPRGHKRRCAHESLYSSLHKTGENAARSEGKIALVVYVLDGTNIFNPQNNYTDSWILSTNGGKRKLCYFTFTSLFLVSIISQLIQTECNFIIP